jgi:peptidoglycan hydrolase-like protein with peptidoglycan-binding domain
MRETFTFNQHAQHAWLHFAIRVIIVLLLMFLILVFTENSLGQTTKQKSRTVDVWQAERRLCELGYWTGPIDGAFDNGSKHALIAFQKIEGRKRTGVLTRGELDAIMQANQPEPVDTTYPHIEIDLRRQVLMFVNEKGHAASILSVSTGNEALYLDGGKWVRAHTPRGQFFVTRKINGLRISRLGALYYPCYIVNGIAIHGSPSVPSYPASHGCIRIPMFAAKAFHDIVPLGTRVVVYDVS